MAKRRSGVPGGYDRDGQDDPVVAEGKGDGSSARAAAHVGRAERVVMHGGSEQVGSASVTQGVVHEHDHFGTGKGQQQVEEDLPQGVDGPACAREESVEGRMVLAPPPHPGRRLDDATDRVAPGTEDPADHEGLEVLEARAREDAGERGEQGEECRWNRVLDHGSPPRCGFGDLSDGSGLVGPGG